MIIYCNQRTKDVISKDYDYAFAAFRYPGVPEMNIHVIGEAPFWIGDIKIEPITVMHYKLPVTAFRIDNFSLYHGCEFHIEGKYEKTERQSNTWVIMPYVKKSPFSLYAESSH